MILKNTFEEENRVKNHKDNFINQPKCRLINPAKSQIGKISSQILKKINKTLRSKLEIPQWQRKKNNINIPNHSLA